MIKYTFQRFESKYKIGDNVALNVPKVFNYLLSIIIIDEYFILKYTLRKSVCRLEIFTFGNTNSRILKANLS